MLKMFFVSLVTQAVLIMTGLSLLQIFSPRRKIRWLEYLPYAWGLGVVVLYIAGGMFVKMTFLRGAWHIAVLAFIAPVISAAFRIRKKTQAPKEPFLTSGKFAWYEWLVTVLIAAKVISVLYVQMVNPVIDSDATHPDLWMGLAKVIRDAGTLAPQVKQTGYHFASLLPAWISMFLPRWHDSLVSLPWFFAYASMIGISFVSSCRILRSRFAALILAYLFASIPLAMIHVIRPGYSDLILSCFFLMGLSVIALGYTRTPAQNVPLWMSVAVLSALGGLLTKHEGVIWGCWMIAVWMGYYLHARRGWTWRKIFGSFLILGIAFYIIAIISVDFLQKMSFINDRFTRLLELRYQPGTMTAFMKMVFWRGSFNLWWWFIFLMVMTLWIKPSSSWAKAMALYVLAATGSVFYLACFTINVEYTMLGTNIARVLLQISGVFLPIYCFFVKEILSPVSGDLLK
ncbi:MAG: hypothetical protein PHN49_06165 [Candidatus Omnitrophica bacterium]|nr:hypothetical protein [Candidatus Omnitrophota bacterium]MDD5671203.1 hypothetical protein [Candidatus Omnitrophota bacterium]